MIALLQWLSEHPWFYLMSSLWWGVVVLAVATRLSDWRLFTVQFRRGE